MRYWCYFANEGGKKKNNERLREGKELAQGHTAKWQHGFEPRSVWLQDGDLAWWWWHGPLGGTGKTAGGQAFLIVTCGVGIQWVGAQDGRSPMMHSLASKSHPTPNANASFSLPPRWQLLLCASCMPEIEIQPHNEVGPISNTTL